MLEVIAVALVVDAGLVQGSPLGIGQLGRGLQRLIDALEFRIDKGQGRLVLLSLQVLQALGTANRLVIAGAEGDLGIHSLLSLSQPGLLFDIGRKVLLRLLLDLVEGAVNLVEFLERLFRNEVSKLTPQRAEGLAQRIDMVAVERLEVEGVGRLNEGSRIGLRTQRA